MTSTLKQDASTPSTASGPLFVPHGSRKNSCEIPMSAYVSLHPLFLRSLEEKKGKGIRSYPAGRGEWSTSL